MSKRSRPIKHYPGELERLTALIEHRAKEIAEVLLWDVPDAEQEAEMRSPVARLSKQRRPDRRGKLKPKRGIRRWSTKTSWPPP